MAQLASKPRGSLRKRFGAEALLRLDQALGNTDEALPSLIPPEVPRAELRFGKLIWGWSREGPSESHAQDLNLNLEDRRLKLTLELARQLIGTPRHLSQHPGGFVLTLDRLDELVPVEPAAMENRQVIEWDKDDIDALKFMKVDVLGLGMLGCMRRAFDLLDKEKGMRLDLATIPAEDPATYAMIRKADTMGTFQIESRAQMSMLPRLQKPIKTNTIDYALSNSGNLPAITESCHCPFSRHIILRHVEIHVDINMWNREKQYAHKRPAYKTTLDWNIAEKQQDQTAITRLCWNT